MISARRLGNGPIVRAGHPPSIGQNVNGPSLVRMPDWAEGRQGRYHLYFAHHRDRFIRLAFADNIEGPWQVHEPDVLDLEECAPFQDHVASPDVHIMQERREVWMYVHGVTGKHPIANPPQSTALAVSTDGLNFRMHPTILGASYFRVWTWQGAFYAVSLGGELWSSPDGRSAFFLHGDLPGLPEQTRHLAVLRKNATLWIAWSVIGDCPERIFIGHVDLATPKWRVGHIQELIRPVHQWEGASAPLIASVAGQADGPVHQLRDPALYSEDGRDFLIYSTAGESGLALAELEGLS